MAVDGGVPILCRKPFLYGREQISYHKLVSHGGVQTLCHGQVAHGHDVVSNEARSGDVQEHGYRVGDAQE